MKKDIEELGKIFDDIKSKLEEIHINWNYVIFEEQIKRSKSVLKRLNNRLGRHIANLEYEYELDSDICELCWENHNGD